MAAFPAFANRPEVNCSSLEVVRAFLLASEVAEKVMEVENHPARWTDRSDARKDRS